jgi:hypothetical protein
MELTQLRIVWGRAVAHLHGVVDWNAAADTFHFGAHP